MSPFGAEIQKDDPSTSVTVPAPSAPAAVSTFHPAIHAPFRNQRRPDGGTRTLCGRPLTIKSTLLLLVSGGQRHHWVECLPVVRNPESHLLPCGLGHTNGAV